MLGSGTDVGVVVVQPAARLSLCSHPVGLASPHTGIAALNIITKNDDAIIFFINPPLANLLVQLFVPQYNELPTLFFLVFFRVLKRAHQPHDQHDEDDGSDQSVSKHCILSFTIRAGPTGCACARRALASLFLLSLPTK